MDEQSKPEIIGTIKNIIFQNSENGYTVLRLNIGGEEPVVVTGIIPMAAPGERLSLCGEWERHPAHGVQFKAESVQRALPVERDQIFCYLASGVIKGIREKTALKLVTAFGTKTLEVLAESPERISAEIREISDKKAREISAEFRSRAGLRHLMEFLTLHGLRSEYAMRLYKLYGESALEEVKSNPYILAMDRIGAPFADADALALSLGFEDDSPERIGAAVIFEMKHNLLNGHSFLTRNKLIAATAQLVGSSDDIVEECLDALLDSDDVVQQRVAGVDAVYLRRIFEAEYNASERIKKMASVIYAPTVDVAGLIERMEIANGLCYAEMQQQAIRLAAERQLLVLTGGPGTGKTTTIRAIISLFDQMGLECLLCAPTGRASQRITELTGQPAYTVHRMLGAGWNEDGDEIVFRKDRENPLQCGAVILDESSMMDITLVNALLEALPGDCRLVLVGDADQLPSVGPGSFLNDILRSGVVATIRLNDVFRQSNESKIVANAHLINSGECPDLKQNKGDFFFLQRPYGERINETVSELCSTRLPLKMGFATEDIQVLTPTRVGDTGTKVINRLLQSKLNPPSPGKKEYVFGETVYREGDKVMQIKNDYDIIWCRGGDWDKIMSGEKSMGSAAETGSGIFNGDVGRILSIDENQELLWVSFDDRLTFYEFSQLRELEHAFAITVHKSQGSEYRAVVLALGRVPERMISRDLLYTAVTRAKELLIIVGDASLAQAMVANGKKARRYSGLRARLNGEVDA